MSQEVSLKQRAWDSFQFLLCLGILGLLFVYLVGLTMGLIPSGQAGGAAVQIEQQSDVSLAGAKSIFIRPDSPIYRKLDIVTVNRTETNLPIVTVTGVNVASLQQTTNGDGTSVEADQLHDLWQFHSAELLEAFTDWQKADVEIAFAEQQLQLTEQLAQASVESHKLAVERLERLVHIGTEAGQELANARAELLQAEIEGQKDIHEAQTEVRLAQREKAMLARQLALAGLQPELLTSISREVDIVMAEVPESMIQRVKAGQRCHARFFSYPERKFYGEVLYIVPVLSQELRSLRVLFAIEDATDLLRPGMFAEVGLGVDPRSVLQVPPESIIHIGGLDYVLVRKSDADWTVTAVQIGELHESGVEVYSGLEDGDQVAGKGVILLKSVIAESLRVR